MEAEANGAIDELRSEMFLTGTLGALRYVINGLADMPGRKSVAASPIGEAVGR